MKCNNCHTDTTHIKYYPGIGERCPYCSDITENTLTDNKLTRNRVRMDSIKFEGDTLPPRKYDKIKRRVVPNEEFIKRTPNGLKNFFQPEELSEHGYNKLADKVIKDKQKDQEAKSDVQHTGDSKKAIKEFINASR